MKRFAWSLLILSSPAFADYKATELRGKVLAWQPWATAWTPISRDGIVQEGALLDVRAQASITLVPVERRANDPATFEIRLPMLLRVERESLRAIQASGQMTARVPKPDPSAKPVADESMLPSFDEAWNRVKATIRRPPPGKDDKAPTGAPTIAASSPNMELVLPTKAPITTTRSRPAEVRVSWRAPAKARGKLFRVVVRRADTGEKTTIEQTREQQGLDHRYVHFEEPGRFLIAVESVDGTFRTIEHEVHVDPEKPNEYTDEALAEQSALPVAIRLLQPAEGFSAVGAPTPLRLNFRWRSDGQGRDVVIVTSEKGKEIARADVDAADGEIALTLPRPGRFLWRVERRDGAAVVTSETRSLAVVGPKERTPSLRELAAKRATTAVYIDTP